MTPRDFQRRTKDIARRVIAVSAALPRTREADVVARQLVKAGTSVAANYRAACRAKSPRDMISNLKVVEEESDETLFWLEMIAEAKMLPEKRVAALHVDMEQVLAMTVASILTLRKHGPGNRQSKVANR